MTDWPESVSEVRGTTGRPVGCRTGKLVMCRSITEACLGAAVAVPPGAAVFIVEDENGFETAVHASTSPFGPLIKRFASPDQDMLDSLVLDTIEGGCNTDVWLYVDDEADREWFSSLAGERGHSVRRLTGDIPPGVDDPASLFAIADGRVSPGVETVSTFFRVDTTVRKPLERGAIVRMDVVIRDGDLREIVFVDQSGEKCGLLGVMPRPLSQDERNAVADVSAEIGGFAYGVEIRHGRRVVVQTCEVGIPADIDRMLADARLPADQQAFQD